MTTASAIATGTEGPVRVALDRLRRYGLGERVIKSALAAGLAWWLAIWIHDDPLPVLAPITAIFTIQLTLARSVLGSVQRILGVGAGVSVAMLASRLIGLHWWVISFVVVFSLLAGFRLFRLEPAGVEQMTVSAMLVMIVGASGNILGVAGYHILDTLIGSAVGLAANSLIAPPSHVEGARLAVRAAGERLVAVIEALATALAGGLRKEEALLILVRARAAAATLDEVEAALDRAEESLRFNLQGRGQKPSMARLRRANRAIEHTSVQVRVISRTIFDSARAAPTSSAPEWIGPRDLGVPLANLFSASAVYLEEFLATATGSSDAMGHTRAELDARARLAEVTSAALVRFEELQPDDWVLVGEVLSITNQLLTDLAAAAGDVIGRSTFQPATEEFSARP